MKLLGKIMLVVLTVVICATCIFTFNASASGIDNDVIDDWDVEFVAGDLDGSGLINTDDLVLLRKYIAGIIPEKDFVFAAADINNDEAINTDDIVYLRKVIAGLI